MCRYEESLLKLINDAGIDKQPAYQTGETAVILSVSQNMVIMLCDKWEPEKPGGLESYRVGTHRRIPHHAIIEYLNINSSYNLL